MSEVEPEPCQRCMTPIHPGFGWCPDCGHIEALESALRELVALKGRSA